MDISPVKSGHLLPSVFQARRVPLTSHNTPFESPLTTLASLFWLACRNRAKPPLHKLTSTQFLVATGTLIQRSLDPRLTIRKGAFCFLLSPRACHTVTPKDVCSELSDARISAPPTAVYHEAFMSLVSKVLFSRIQTKRVPEEEGSRGITATQYPWAKTDLPKSEKELLTSQMLN